jgi:hypothetical protein
MVEITISRPRRDHREHQEDQEPLGPSGVGAGVVGAGVAGVAGTTNKVVVVMAGEGAIFMGTIRALRHFEVPKTLP